MVAATHHICGGLHIQGGLPKIKESATILPNPALVAVLEACQVASSGRPPMAPTPPGRP